MKIKNYFNKGFKILKNGIVPLFLLFALTSTAQSNVSNTVSVGNHSLFKSTAVDSIKTGALFYYKLHVSLFGDNSQIVTITDQLPTDIELVGGATAIDISTPAFQSSSAPPTISSTNLVTITLQAPISDGSNNYLEILLPVRFKGGITPNVLV